DSQGLAAVDVEGDPVHRPDLPRPAAEEGALEHREVDLEAPDIQERSRRRGGPGAGGAWSGAGGRPGGRAALCCAGAAALDLSFEALFALAVHATQHATSLPSPSLRTSG